MQNGFSQYIFKILMDLIQKHPMHNIDSLGRTFQHQEEQNEYSYMYLQILFAEEDSGKTQLGIIELVALSGGPIVVLCVIFVTLFILYHRYKSKKVPRPVDPNPIDTPLLPDGQPHTLVEMMNDYSGSGSGNDCDLFVVGKVTKLLRNKAFENSDGKLKIVR